MFFVCKNVRDWGLLASLPGAPGRTTRSKNVTRCVIVWGGREKREGEVTPADSGPHVQSTGPVSQLGTQTFAIEGPEFRK